MAELYVSEAAEDFLDALYESDEVQAALMDVVMQEICDDEQCLATLHHDTPKFVYHLEHTFEFKRFRAAWDLGYSVYILKPYDDDGHRLDYRMLVAHDTRFDYFYVLRIAHRDNSYDATSPEFAELLKDYDDHGLPTR